MSDVARSERCVCMHVPNYHHRYTNILVCFSCPTMTHRGTAPGFPLFAVCRGTRSLCATELSPAVALQPHGNIVVRSQRESFFLIHKPSHTVMCTADTKLSLPEKAIRLLRIFGDNFLTFTFSPEANVLKITPSSGKACLIDCCSISPHRARGCCFCSQPTTKQDREPTNRELNGNGTGSMRTVF